ncbi:MAG: hypothetical protein JWR78_746, partial [Mycobacterium sp.]|nr:hypothetical protein [Mycobacterium sp.]
DLDTLRDALGKVREVVAAHTHL